MYEKITLDNGVKILFENIPHVRSVSLGVWVGTGSRCENTRENGASHFIEHMVFKGTGRRSASQLASEMDALGGQTNAFTTKECTCFYGRVLDTRLPQLTDILCDMLFNSAFAEEDVVNERGVVLEEIDMYEDTPDDLVAERLFAACYKGCSLARPILGKKSTLDKMDGEFLRRYMRRRYLPKDITVALSGSFTDRDIELIKSAFSPLEGDGVNVFPEAVYTPAFTVKRKPIEQNHLMLAFPGLSDSHEDRYTMQILSTILGGGMSSRLFQSVREKRGLCYSIYSYNTSYKDTGLFCVYTALGSDTEKEAIDAIMTQIDIMCTDKVPQEELECAVEQAKSNILMGLESTSTRMNRLARSEMCLGYVPEIDDLIRIYDSITSEDVRSLAQRVFDLDKLSFSAVGRVKRSGEYREMLSANF
ncbi:MAG: insulinase family protein [Oscillospiraceae bacterium]|nr:insulinase family protein [Oscillospiraceae bacterium]